MDYYYTYEFSIYLPKRSNATIMLPVPIIDDNIIGFNYSSLTFVDGTGSAEIYDSMYGKCLKITVNLSIEVHHESKIKMNKNNEYLKSKLSTFDTFLDNCNLVIKKQLESNK